MSCQILKCFRKRRGGRKKIAHALPMPMLPQGEFIRKGIELELRPVLGWTSQ